MGVWAVDGLVVVWGTRDVCLIRGGGGGGEGGGLGTARVGSAYGVVGGCFFLAGWLWTRTLDIILELPYSTCWFEMEY